MRKVWTILFSIIIFTAIGWAGVFPSFKKANVVETTSDNLDDLNKIELLSAVPLGKEAELIKKFQKKEGLDLLKKFERYKDIMVETTRGGEVLLITIPASRLFMPNDIDLTARAHIYLEPFKRYLKRPDMYWVILDMHTDNTGSEAYTDSLALNRVNSVFSWFADSGCDTRYLFPTASGQNEPLPNNNNQSMEDRAKNRRLEIYLVPGKLMLESAKNGRIVF